MPRGILGAVVMMPLLAVGIAAQGTMEQRMQSMQQRMQSMEQHRQSMQEMMQSRSQEGGMHGMQQMQGQQNGSGMQGMTPQTRTPSQSCLASGPQAGLSALLMGPVGGLDLTEAQSGALEEIMARAQTAALAALTPDQRERLESAEPGTSPACQGTPRGSGGAAGN